ncbi:MAG: hypothetical protein KJ941_04400, partial [Bacteroidetes bacterium]|nr:hypothetical protein [Bacteroidota bacterium]
MKHLLQKPLFQFFFLLFGGGLFLWLLGCFDWLFSEPTGVHYIRQTDCLAFVQHYFQHGNPWWQPAVYDLNTFEGRGASEFPLFYYLIAKIWSYTGQVDWYLRLWNFGWVIAGIVGFWFFLKRELQSVWISWMVCLLTFTGTVFWYYAPNYLPDVASLGMCFIGFYFLTHENRTRKTLLLTFLFLTLAGLMKPTLLVLPTAFVLSNVLIDILQSIKNQRLVLHSKGIVLAFSSAILVSFAWVVYVKWYNSSVNNIYFLFEPRPIWTNSVEERSEVWSFLSEKWAYRRYANDQVLQLWSAMMILPLLGFRKLKLKWYLTHLFSLLGSVCLFLLFF